MQQPLEFYIQQKSYFEAQLKTLKKQLSVSSTIRFVVFLVAAFGIYLVWGDIQAMLIVVALGAVVFIFLVLKHTKLQYKSDFNKALLAINTTEINVLSGDFSALNKGEEFIDQSHFYSYDIDIFGRLSFFQYSNRTVTIEGKKKYANYLIENNISSIEEKQLGIKELSKKPTWRQHFSALASLVKTDFSAGEVVDWIHNYTSVFPKFLKLIPLVFSTISMLLIGLAIFNISPIMVAGLWLFVGLGISGVYFKKVNVLYKYSSNIKDTFKQYNKLLNEVENTTFTSKILKEQQLRIQTETKKASKIVGEFSKLLDALDQRNNLIIAFLGNGFLLWDLQQVYKIENWIETYKAYVENWFDVISFFDAQNSMANVAFNHPDYVFPEIEKNKTKRISAENLGHFLLNKEVRIDNDLNIDNHQFFIVTGANMAGKSTFLRTVSIAIMMANLGLPVCASKFVYSPIKLITSMRTTDSLADDESYFFSELKRLKLIVDEIVHEDYFIVLDEILKGTNSTDKAIGSKKFVQKLVASNSTGIIATHDLSLCEIEKDLAEVKNYYFDAEIINNQLHFDYKLKDGVCKNMNASFLLKKMEIV